jgi:hypothetical protein
VKGEVYRERHKRFRYAGVVTSHVDGVRVQTVQRVFGVWVRRYRSRIGTITQAEFARRFVKV